MNIVDDARRHGCLSIAESLEAGAKQLEGAWIAWGLLMFVWGARWRAAAGMIETKARP